MIGRLAAEVSATSVGAARTEARARPAHRRLRWAIPQRGVALAAIFVGALAAGAGAYGLETHTGIFGNPSFSEEDGSEYLRTDAPDFHSAVIAAIPADVPAPPGGWAPLVRRVVAEGQAEPGLIQKTGVSSELSYKALCSWTGAWLAGARNPQSAATRAIGGAAGWRTMVETDGGGVVALLRVLGSAAQHGDTAAIEQYRNANCEPDQ